MKEKRARRQSGRALFIAGLLLTNLKWILCEADTGGTKVGPIEKFPDYPDSEVSAVWSRVRKLLSNDSKLASPAAAEDGDEVPSSGNRDEDDEFVLETELREQMEDSLRGAIAEDPPRNVYGVSLHDVELATALSFKELISPANFEAGAASRDALLRWEGWIAHSHPSSRCREGAWKVMGFLEWVWPEDIKDSDLHPKFRLQLARNLTKLKQCGPEVQTKKGKYAFEHCTDYTCGLWETFHAMSVSASNKEVSGANMMSALRGFIDKFFSCSTCREHFLQVLAKEKTELVETSKDFALWLWESHNVVNMRLAQEEEERGTGDPARPKHAFPHPVMCESCFRSVHPMRVSEGGIYAFLCDHYRFKQSKSEVSGQLESGKEEL